MNAKATVAAGGSIVGSIRRSFKWFFGKEWVRFIDIMVLLHLIQVEPIFGREIL